ncbi:P-loop containing nucleoside triphosphate hydrolase protein, partial [Teratosphaeria nubilosa]
KAQRTYYGINIHALLDEAQAEMEKPKPAVDLPTPPAEPAPSRKPSLLWTEKYRARKFTDLIGDERTHRSVMQWLKRWDPIVFPGSYRPAKKPQAPNAELEHERPHRKILMLTGPPGLGKTTLAHVCAKQAGYEVQELNASDERSGAVVKGRIRDMVGTENVKGVDTKTVDGKVRKAGKPVCVIVDEVDGVVGSGAEGGSEGGFVKALIDLVLLDQKNSAGLGNMQQAPARKKKGDRFRLLRPLILICNDVYHPSLRHLRQSSHAEIIHMRKPQIQTVAARMESIFAREGVPCEADGVRRLCEATWGVSSRKEDRAGAGAGEGDIRGIMVVGEWVAGKLRAMNETTSGDIRLTRRWVEEHILQDLAHGGGATRGLGRGGPKDIVDRVFKEGAGFPKSTASLTPPHHPTGYTNPKGVAEGLKRTATERLRQLIDTHGDTDRIITDCFSTYPDHPFQDDTFLSKPAAAYEWLHFHDALSHHIFGGTNDWDLAPYLSTPILAFHHLFASPTRSHYSNPLPHHPTSNPSNPDPTTQPHPFTTAQAPRTAHEATKSNESLLLTLQTSLSLPLARAFPSPPTITTDLLPYLLRMLAPNIHPILLNTNTSGHNEESTASVRKASEQALVARAVNAMAASGLRFERTRVTPADDEGRGMWRPSSSGSQWVYRLEPPVDVLGCFDTGGTALAEELVGAVGGGKQRFAVRRVLEQEWAREEKRRAEGARKARLRGVADEASIGVMEVVEAEGKKVVVQRDFFGRPVMVDGFGAGAESARQRRREEEGRVWVTFHEGFSNAVRKPVSLAELMRGM